MSASQRRKGAAYEREVVQTLRDTIGVKCGRNLGQARDGGDDITLRKAGGGRFRLECKRRDRIAVEGFLEQAEAAAGPGDVPLVVMRADGSDSMVLMRLGHFLPMLAGELVCDSET